MTREARRASPDVVKRRNLGTKVTAETRGSGGGATRESSDPCARDDELR